MGRRRTGIVRRLDPLGRYCIPIETRRVRGWSESTSLEMSEEDDGAIVLTEYLVHCTFCPATKGLRDFMGRLVCPSCMAALAERGGQIRAAGR